jgi:hypothetical protein
MSGGNPVGGLPWLSGGSNRAMTQPSAFCLRASLAAFLIFGASVAPARAQSTQSSATASSVAYASAASAAGTPNGMSSLPPACDPDQLSFAVDRENGQFDGMSHSGTLLVLRNLGSQACSVPARPEISFLDNGHNALPVSLGQTPGMHPGPVILPVVVPPGAELTSEARWVSSDAYGANNCVSPEFIALAIGPRTLVAPLSTHICGPAGQHPSYTVTLLRRDPPYEPARR